MTTTTAVLLQPPEAAVTLREARPCGGGVASQQARPTEALLPHRPAQEEQQDKEQQAQLRWTHSGSPRSAAPQSSRDGDLHTARRAQLGAHSRPARAPPELAALVPLTPTLQAAGDRPASDQKRPATAVRQWSRADRSLRLTTVR